MILGHSHKTSNNKKHWFPFGNAFHILHNLEILLGDCSQTLWQQTVLQASELENTTQNPGGPTTGARVLYKTWEILYEESTNEILPLLDQRKYYRAKTDSRNSVWVSLSVESREGPQLKPDVLCCFTLFCSSVLTVEMFHILLVSPVASPVAQLRFSNTQNLKHSEQRCTKTVNKRTYSYSGDVQFRAFCDTQWAKCQI